ncbi:hypothetical protein TTHERM_000647419 (macronuclear) [Tetrahymena thermophila SB210]|uniref:Uncharacterized protein n=1 Tax=Tetrahymena thermophila (strain SB210) TaxID=312017 RepID=W7WW80_TETTS|nr:hypothetical protein TTHERM_000647419 [Tetrahymena thermophila SB210]EWS71095.1 hypothetical protein TTHERM_000647419 [Tetrahymena thermophila SB210]|eukprot:XP_012656394.1 hypothetical protein TTHERM_000647419 [Tetrahymena thermophila SB210]
MLTYQESFLNPNFKISKFERNKQMNYRLAFVHSNKRQHLINLFLNEDLLIQLSCKLQNFHHQNIRLKILNHSFENVDISKHQSLPYQLQFLFKIINLDFIFQHRRQFLKASFYINFRDKKNKKKNKRLKIFLQQKRKHEQKLRKIKNFEIKQKEQKKKKLKKAYKSQQTHTITKKKFVSTQQKFFIFYFIKKFKEDG